MQGLRRRKNAEGKEESYNPPRYTFSYGFYITLNINHPWFDEIKFKVNSGSIEGRGSPEFRDTERQANELCETLQNLHSQVMEAAKPKSSVNCPACGARPKRTLRVLRRCWSTDNISTALRSLTAGELPSPAVGCVAFYTI